LLYLILKGWGELDNIIPQHRFNMSDDKVSFFMATNAKYFPSEKFALIKDRLDKSDESKLLMYNSIEYKDPQTMLLISIFLGSLGIDRFMLGETGMGILKLLTFGLCGILTIIDWINITKMTKEYNFKKFYEVF
jgi:TM2 domain-containing membrane protein YozV